MTSEPKHVCEYVITGVSFSQKCMTFSGDLAAVPITGVCTILRQEVGVPCPCNLYIKRNGSEYFNLRLIPTRYFSQPDQGNVNVTQ